MRIDGRANASNDPGDMGTQILSGLLPILLAPRADDVFLIGWGSGVTVGAALQSSAVKHLTAVELEPAVVDGSRYFTEINHDPESDERLELFVDDARHILLASDRTYDVIISEPSHPWVAGVANLFTQDFYRLVDRRLRPGGVFAQWIQTYQLTFENYRTILASVTSVFPYAMIFYTPGIADTVVIATREPLEIDFEKLAARWGDPGVRAELGRIRYRSPEQIVAAVALGPDQVRDLARNAPINTDDNMRVEFSAAAGSLVDLYVRPELDRRSGGPETVLEKPGIILDDPERLRRYVEGLELVGRDPKAYREQLEQAPEG
jgi:spermidine synthase